MKKGKDFALLIYADWCPHCMNLKDAWNDASKTTKCNVVEVNDCALSLLRGLQQSPFTSVLSAPSPGFPSINHVSFDKTGQKITVYGYNGDRDQNSFNAFFNSIQERNTINPKDAKKQDAKKQDAKRNTTKTNDAKKQATKRNTIKPKTKKGRA